MAAPNFFLLNWNVRGLNALVKPCGLKDMVLTVKAIVVCLQETKLQEISESPVTEMLGVKFKSNFSFLPSAGTCGGIQIAAFEDHFRSLSSSRTRFTLTVRIQVLLDASEWAFTGAYGPQLKVDKIAFLEELRVLCQHIQGEWLVIGDFNLILRAEDKNNTRVNRRFMGQFWSLLDDIELKELLLQGKNSLRLAVRMLKLR
jgi:exonuclease III